MVLDLLVQSRRDPQAARRLLCKLMKRQCRAPRVMITDKLASYGAAKRAVMPCVEHRKHKGLNNRAENSRQPTRRRERPTKRFKSAGCQWRMNSGSPALCVLFSLVPPMTDQGDRGLTLMVTSSCRLPCYPSCPPHSKSATCCRQPTMSPSRPAWCEASLNVQTAVCRPSACTAIIPACCETCRGRDARPRSG